MYVFAEKYAVYALCKRPRPQVSSSASQYLSTRLERVHGSNDDAFECHAALRCRSRKIVGGCAWGAYGWPFVLPQIKKAFAEVKETFPLKNLSFLRSDHAVAVGAPLLDAQRTAAIQSSGEHRIEQHKEEVLVNCVRLEDQDRFAAL